MDPPVSYRDRVALPNYGWRLTAPKPRPGYPTELKHMGDCIRKRRMDLGLSRKELARELGTNGWTVKHWEEHLKLRVELRFMPRIIAFLGYNPLPTGRTRGKTIIRERVTRGWSRKRLAEESGVDEATVRRVESDSQRVAKRVRKAILETLDIKA